MISQSRIRSKYLLLSLKQNSSRSFCTIPSLIKLLIPNFFLVTNSDVNQIEIQNSFISARYFSGLTSVQSLRTQKLVLLIVYESSQDQGIFWSNPILFSLQSLGIQQIHRVCNDYPVFMFSHIYPELLVHFENRFISHIPSCLWSSAALNPFLVDVVNS